MESTGEYWKPVCNILEGHMEILLVNARQLLRGSFVPPREQRELRDLTRQRSNLVRERASVVNRLQKVLEDANIKLASVVSDVMGVSARAMLEVLIDGKAANPELRWPSWLASDCATNEMNWNRR